MPVVLFVLEGTYWDVVDIRSRIPAFQLPKKAIELNRFRRFEYEYEYRKAEYEKAELSTTTTPEEPEFLNSDYHCLFSLKERFLSGSTSGSQTQ
jgi:hypothetical protein